MEKLLVFFREEFTVGFNCVFKELDKHSLRWRFWSKRLLDIVVEIYIIILGIHPWWKSTFFDSFALCEYSWNHPNVEYIYFSWNFRRTCR